MSDKVQIKKNTKAAVTWLLPVYILSYLVKPLSFGMESYLVHMHLPLTKVKLFNIKYRSAVLGQFS